jgi:hypothetical protein
VVLKEFIVLCMKDKKGFSLALAGSGNEKNAHVVVNKT